MSVLSRDPGSSLRSPFCPKSLNPQQRPRSSQSLNPKFKTGNITRGLSKFERCFGVYYPPPPPPKKKKQNNLYILNIKTPAVKDMELPFAGLHHAGSHDCGHHHGSAPPLPTVPGKIKFGRGSQVRQACYVMLLTLWPFRLM